MKRSELTVGRTIDCGSRLVSEAEILEFARRYDPQPFHVDREFAEASQWQGLIASGWMTCAIAMERIAKVILAGSESIGSPGIDELRWEGPVRAGDVLGVRVHIIESRPSSNGRYWVVRWRWEVHNQRGERVLHCIPISLFRAGDAS